LSIGGLHNVQNALATIAVAKIMGISTKDIAMVLLDFKGINHRIQAIATVDGVSYVNDSKGTNVDATLKAISAMKTETILLLGGKNKGYDYAPLFSALPQSKVVHAILYGENRFELFNSARKVGFEDFTLCRGFEEAVKISSSLAKEGQTVLLSPASASFDEFISYEERGDKFVQIVRVLAKEKEKTKLDGETRELGILEKNVAESKLKSEDE
jgi:UDP-N-acetylmuramoylalanine--D-glutamate ligase